MDGIVSLLPQPYYQQVETIWDRLEDSFGLRGIRVTPYPHFSWQVASGYDPEGSKTALEFLAAHTPPFIVRTTGLGLFTGAQPVIYITVVKTRELVTLHQEVWDALELTASDLSPYYHPRSWVPHISLAYLDVTPDSIGPVMRSLAFADYNWEMTIDNFTHLYEPDGLVAELKVKAPFQG